MYVSFRISLEDAWKGWLAASCGGSCASSVVRRGGGGLVVYYRIKEM